MTKVILVQFTETFQSHYFYPYSAGMIQVYAQKHAIHSENFLFAPPLFKREPVEDILPKITGFDIVGFSTYVWNIKLCLKLAQLIKEKMPNTLIVLGGPQVPNRSQPFMEENPFVDLCVHGEGERTFTEILDHYPSRDWSGIEGITYRQVGGNIIKNKSRARAKDLSEFPSPYLEGVFDPLMRYYPNIKWMAAWETNRGCPFGCSFCDWGSAIRGKIFKFEMPRLKAEMDWIGKNKVEKIFSCDANFSILKRDLEIAEYLAETKLRFGFPIEFHQQTAKNSTERNFKTHQILEKAGIFSDATISLQSLDQNTLKHIKRENISLQSYIDLQKQFTAKDIPSYTDLILGLPEETYNTFSLGIEKAILLGQHSRLQIYNAMILPNAEMAQPEYRSKYGLETTEIRMSTEVKYPPDIIETKEIVIGTRTMPKSDWVKAKSFAWMTKFLYFHHKPLQIPIILINQLTGLGFKTIFEAFSEVGTHFRVLYEIRNFFILKSKAVQNGDMEYCTVDCDAYQLSSVEEWNVIPEMFATLELCLGKQLDAFYIEAWQCLEALLKAHNLTLPKGLLYQSIAFNSALFKVSFMIDPKEPHFDFHQAPIRVQTDYNIKDLYESALRGQIIDVSRLPESQIFYKNWAGAPYGLENKAIVMSPSPSQ